MHAVTRPVTVSNYSGNFVWLLSIAPPGAFSANELLALLLNVASFSGSALDVQSVDIGIEAEVGGAKAS